MSVSRETALPTLDRLSTFIAAGALAAIVGGAALAIPLRLDWLVVPYEKLGDALIVLSQVMRLGVGRLLGPDEATTLAHTLTYSLALLGMGTLLLALTAIYTRASIALAKLGLIGYVIGFLGTLMVAGDWWFEAFVIPRIAAAAPEVLDLPPSGSVLASVIATVGLYTVGWIPFGLAALRARVVPRAAALLLLAGGLAGPLALSTPYQIPSDRHRLDRPHPEAGISQPAPRSQPATTTAHACSSACRRTDIDQQS